MNKKVYLVVKKVNFYDEEIEGAYLNRSKAVERIEELGYIGINAYLDEVKIEDD